MSVTAEPIARRAHEMTLFIPPGAGGFVSPETGEVTLRRILVPVDRAPAPQPAVDATAALLGGGVNRAAPWDRGEPAGGEDTPGWSLSLGVGRP